jgi:hypothetical protein
MQTFSRFTTVEYSFNKELIFYPEQTLTENEHNAHTDLQFGQPGMLTVVYLVMDTINFSC